MWNSAIFLLVALANSPVSDHLRVANPVVVSPGDPAQFSSVSGRCPTFHWAQVAGADRYELVIFAVPRENETPDSEAREPALSTRVHGGATGWTPAADQCLSADQSYAWSVRAAAGSDLSPWAEPRLFQIASAPDQAELDQALDTLRRYRRQLATQGDPDTDSAAGPRSSRTPRQEQAADPEGSSVIGVEAPLHASAPHFAAHGDGTAEAHRLFAFTATPLQSAEQDGAVVIGHPGPRNNVNSGRLQFDESINESSECGFRFLHDGQNNRLTLEGGCEPIPAFASIAVFDRSGPVTFKDNVTVDKSATVDNIAFSKLNGNDFTGPANGQLVLSFQGNASSSCNSVCSAHAMACDGAYQLDDFTPSAFRDCSDIPSDVSPRYLCFCSGP